MTVDAALARQAGQRGIGDTCVLLQDNTSEAAGVSAETGRADILLKAGTLHNAIFNSANFSSIATDAKGVIQIFNVGAERMLGYAAADVLNMITPADISDPQEVFARARALSAELGTPITPGFEALVVQGLPRDRGHLRADLHPQGRQPVSRRSCRSRRCATQDGDHRLPADRHRQHRAQADRRRAEEARERCATSTSIRARSSSRTSTP